MYRTHPAIIGLCGVTTFLMMQRKPEVGIRIALGASRRHMLVITC